MRLLKVAPLACAFFLTACAPFHPVESEPPSPVIIGDDATVPGNDKDRRGHARIRVPRRIHSEHRRLYQAYHSGRVYYQPHRHYHTRYRFPVLVDGVVVYRPYVYCNEQLFLSAAVRLPRLAIDVELRPRRTNYNEGYYDPYDDKDDKDHHRHHDKDDDD